MNKIINLAEKLISIPSVSNNPKALEEILEICKKELPNSNFKEYEKDGNRSLIFFDSPTLPEKFKIILNGHLDVVEAKKNQYKPYQKGGKLFGRGSYDMKTSIATMIILFKELAKKINYPLGLQLVTDEEIGGFKGTKYQIEQGIKADFVIAGENTDLKINHKSKGIIWLKIKTKGISAHGAYPWLGKNAIWKMLKGLSILEQTFPQPTDETWNTTINLSMIDTVNKAYNKVPDECTAYFDIRYIPEDKDLIINKIKNKLDENFEIEIFLKEPEHSTEESNKYIDSLSKCIKEITKKDAELVHKHGASDIRHYNQISCDGITFGPVGGGHHSDNEWVDIKSIQNYYDILNNFLNSI